MAYSTIIKPNTQFNPVTYTGNGTTQSITGVNFQPDFVWIKKRDGTVNHYLLDSIRGATKVLYSNATNAEETNTNSLTAFNSDGFSLGNDTDVNVNSGTFVSWNWLGGGTASSNTDGSITSSVSANTTSGFSIVSWTGTGATAVGT
jgi:phage major head subunit gpT-like protein